MTTDELDHALRQLRLGGMADALSIRSQQARAGSLGPLDFIGLLVHDELQRRRDRLIERRIKAAGFRDQRTLDAFDWKFNTLDRALIFELANCRFIEQHEDALLLGNAGVGNSHIAQAIGMAASGSGRLPPQRARARARTLIYTSIYTSYTPQLKALKESAV